VIRIAVRHDDTVAGAELILIANGRRVAGVVAVPIRAK
jgi:hypothetical protein